MEVHSEIIVVGTEMLLGMGVDTNGPDAARELAGLGCPPRWKTLVGDDDDDLEEVLRRAVGRSDVVLLSGGLGPTLDDRTRFAAARVAGADLELRTELLEDIQEAFRRYGRPMTPSNEVQAQLPRGAEAIRNPYGTAPGFALEQGRAWVVALPGVPREFRPLLAEWVLPRLRRRLGVQGLAQRVLRLSGVGESRAGEAVADLMGPGKNPYVGMLASPGEVRVFVVARADSDEEARSLLEAPTVAVRERLGKYLFAEGEQTHAAVALDAAAAAGWSLATVEGYTGGLLAEQLREEAGPVYAGGEVLPQKAVAELSGGGGAASAEGAVARLAEEAARRLGAAAGLSVALGSELQAGGDPSTAWIGLWATGREAAKAFRLSGADGVDRLRVVQQAFYELRRFAGKG